MHSSRMRTVPAVCRSLLPGGCFPGVWDVLPRGGVLPEGVCFLGVCFPGGVLSGGASPGGVVSQHALRQTPPVNRITDTSKNITLATTLSRPVINTKYLILCSFICTRYFKFEFTWLNNRTLYLKDPDSNVSGIGRSSSKKLN